MANTDLVVLGDSVMWGQGLLEQHKSAALVATGLSAKIPGVAPINFAHSGAVIGRAMTCGNTTWPGEVPQSCPTILQQVNDYQGDAGSVAFVMLDGGINDIDVRTILNPFTKANDLANDIHQYCYADMGFLLSQVKLKFPNATIAVSSYFPILSPQSDLNQLAGFMELMGAPLPALVTAIALNPGDPVVAKILGLCAQFFAASTQAYANCVRDVNLGPGPRCCFAAVPFTDANSALAPNAWLFGVGPAPLFDAQDEVVALRRPQCDAAFPNDVLAREQCYRASAGHPTATGAQQYAKAILNAFGV